jgi:alpha-tubulin suppressor-like RCC1 family protein
LRHDALLEAAHIVGDRETLGEPTVPNGIALCTVAAGYRFSLALRNDGRVFAWGDDSLGQLGDGSIVFRVGSGTGTGADGRPLDCRRVASSFAIKSNGSVVACRAGVTSQSGNVFVDFNAQLR